MNTSSTYRLSARGTASNVEFTEEGEIVLWGSQHRGGGYKKFSRFSGCALTKEEAENLVYLLAEKLQLKPWGAQ